MVFMKINNEIVGFLKVFSFLFVYIFSVFFFLVDFFGCVKFISVLINDTSELLYCFLRSLGFAFFNIVAISIYSKKTNAADKDASYVVSYLLNIVVVSTIISIVYFFFEYLFTSYYSHIDKNFFKLFIYESLPSDANGKPVPLDAGQIGDYFGGILNPIVGFSSLIILSLTLIVVHKSMNNAKESSDLFKDQFLIQRFEDTFFSMLNVLIAMGQKVYQIHNIHNNNYGTDQHSIISDAYKALIVKYNEDSRSELISSHKDINSLFRMMYQILKHVDEHFFSVVNDKSENELIEKQLKKAKKYTNIVRSTLDSDTYHLLLLNCMVDDGDKFEDYKKYLEKYAFIEHITLDQEASSAEYATFMRDVEASYCNEKYKNTFGDQVGVIESFVKSLDEKSQAT